MASALGRRLWRALAFTGSSLPEYSPLADVFVAPSWFFLSPGQLWISPLISRVNKATTIEEDWLPQFDQSAAALRTVFAVLGEQHGGVVAFLLQFDTGGMLVLGGALEVSGCFRMIRLAFSIVDCVKQPSYRGNSLLTSQIMSAVAALAGPLILHSFLQSTDSVSLASAMVVCTLLATLCGRSKDQVCRVHSAWIECMLRSVIFDKSFHLSPAARISHPPAKVINVNAVDVGFLTNYVLKIHDVWSAPLQIIGIAFLTFGVMGWTSVFGNFLLFSGRIVPLTSSRFRTRGGNICQPDRPWSPHCAGSGRIRPSQRFPPRRLSRHAEQHQGRQGQRH